MKMVLSSASSPSRSKGSCSGFGFMCPACKHPNAGIWDFGLQRPGPCSTCSANDAASGRIDIDIGKRAAVITLRHPLRRLQLQRLQLMLQPSLPLHQQTLCAADSAKKVTLKV